MMNAITLAKYTERAAQALAALQSKDTHTLQSCMQAACERYARRMMLADWAIDIKSDPEAYQDIVQDIACMLLTAADAKYGKELVPLRVMDQAAAYKVLVGRAKRISMHVYGVTRKSAPLLQALPATDAEKAERKALKGTGRKVTGRYMYKTLSIDGMGRNAHSAERAYLDGLDTAGTWSPDADTLHQAERMERVESAVPEASVLAVLKALTPGEMRAFKAYIGGTYGGDGVTRLKKRLAAFVKAGALDMDTLSACARYIA